MPRSAGSPDRQDTAPLDWDQARLRFRRLLQSMAGSADPYLLDDLVQESCVRLLRVSRRAPVREPEALMAVLARRTWIDHLRRAVRTRERFTALGEDYDRVGDPNPASSPDLGDPGERLALVVQEIFLEHGSHECLELLRGFLAVGSWRALAGRMNVNYSAVRKRWSRCLAVPRAELAADADLASWLG